MEGTSRWLELALDRVEIMEVVISKIRDITEDERFILRQDLKSIKTFIWNAQSDIDGLPNIGER